MDEFGPKVAVPVAPSATVPVSGPPRLQAHQGVNRAAFSSTFPVKDDVELMVTRLRTRLRQAVATVSAERPSSTSVSAATAYHHVQRSPPSLAELLANPMALAVTASSAHNGDILASLSAASRLSSQLALSAANSARSRDPVLARDTKPVLSTTHLASSRYGPAPASSATVTRAMLASSGPSGHAGASTTLPEPTRSSGAAESHSSLAAQLPAAAYHEMEEAALAILQMINDTATAPAHALAGSPSTTATSRTPGSPAPSSMSSPPDAAAALTPAMGDLALSSSPAPENAPFDFVVEDVDGMAEMGAAALLAMNHYAPSGPSSPPPNADAAGVLGPPPPPPAKLSFSAPPSFVAPRRRVKSLSAATASSTGPRTSAANLIMARRSSLHGLEPASAPAAAAAAAAAASASARPRPRPAHLPPPLSSSSSRKRRRSLSAAEHLIIGQLARSPLATSFLSAMAAGPAPSSSSSSHLLPSSAAGSSSSSETAGKRRRLTLTSRDLSSATEEVVDLQSAATALVGGGGGMPRSPPPPLHSVSPAAGARPRSLHSIQEDMNEEAQLEGSGQGEVDVVAGTSGDGMAPMQS
ncbi:hypothetical protein AMAG_11600 [Allomyces macrogynus ATCC 38327]|uniref:Uncharacterized protein n=1 Tax=Allomyces macrogynus (strain ATCC 38327) TaxID=578462 RepID=A0A0L0SV80_ALLM3|nr:hypothetical protein AMAG_11600 [Allomyces macrogynus ATCC 38327]|eukprot:KNE66463.1 hypothetical protein AMAG_11600 [Allomyces macrogynus ATCC 38327]